MAHSVEKIFAGIDDPRVEGRCLHRLKDILFIALCTLLSNGEDFEDMVEFGNQRYDWLKGVLDLPNGIPSHDTFNRVLQVVDPEQLSASLAQGGDMLIENLEGKQVNFDGKKIKGASPKSRGNKGLYILSAWVGEHRFCIGQKKVQDKSNEISAIPELIGALDLRGSMVSIDAIGCQTEIAQEIIDAQADYLLAVKANQGSLYEQASDEFTWASSQDFNEEWEYDHGRYERRKCSTVAAEEVLSPDLIEKWAKVKTVIKIEAQRTVDNSTTSQTRFYISSEEKESAYYNNAVRAHWGIENHLHWHLDVTFNEDANRSRAGNTPQNLNILRKMALHRIRRMTDKLSLKKRRFRASMNVEYLQKVIGV